ncbi:hypothetical protein GCM10011360_33760 [Primorskyibacter flagellatus]|uniref:Uncharacterized protein n=1 Tax=Primorskyibacter flagellatus TaxID=1387277 RepID=A0A917ACN2_9RHOB|nr:hypothetical protein GCM10011360_33760 [Primorskyibacter flagellatus]
MQAHDGRQRLDQPRLAEAGQADQQPVTAAEQGGEGQFHDLFLTNEAAFDGFPGLGELFFHRLDPGYEVVVLGGGHGKGSVRDYSLGQLYRGAWE